MSEGIFFSQILGRSHQSSLHKRMLGKGVQLKTTALLVFFLWLVKSEKLVNIELVEHLGKCALFSDFQYGFRSSRSTAYLPTVASDRIASLGSRVRARATRAVALDIVKAFDRVWHAGLLHKLTSFGISGQPVGRISSFLINRWL